MRGTVLLVEDSEIIALDTEDMLRSLGFDDVVHVRTCAEAFDALRAQSFDCAVLDINLAEETSFPVARRLMQLRTAFVFATGYGVRALEGDLAKTVIVAKPYTEQSLGRALHGVVSSLRDAPALAI